MMVEQDMKESKPPVLDYERSEPTENSPILDVFHFLSKYAIFLECSIILLMIMDIILGMDHNFIPWNIYQQLCIASLANFPLGLLLCVAARDPARGKLARITADVIGAAAIISAFVASSFFHG